MFNILYHKKQGRRTVLCSGGAMVIGMIMSCTISICSMLMLGGLGACLPGKIDTLRLNLGAFCLES